MYGLHNKGFDYGQIRFRIIPLIPAFTS